MAILVGWASASKGYANPPYKNRLLFKGEAKNTYLDN